MIHITGSRTASASWKLDFISSRASPSSPKGHNAKIQQFGKTLLCVCSAVLHSVATIKLQIGTATKSEKLVNTKGSQVTIFEVERQGIASCRKSSHSVFLQRGVSHRIGCSLKNCNGLQALLPNAVQQMHLVAKSGFERFRIFAPRVTCLKFWVLARSGST